MKRQILYLSIALSIGATSLISCDDYDIEQKGYDDNMKEAPADTSAIAPQLDASWQLELIPNIGKQGANVFVYKDQKYNRLFTRNLGWNGGQGASSTLLPNGDVLWVFNDSFFGTVDPTTRTRLKGNMPHNCLMIQRNNGGKLGETPDDLVWLVDYVNTTDPNSPGYFEAATHLPYANNATDETITTTNPIKGNVYRVGDAIVNGDEVQILWIGTMDTNNAITGLTTLTSYSLSGSMPSAYYLSGLADYNPKEGDYMYRTNVMAGINKYRTPYGMSLFEDADGYTYIYATNTNEVIVARVAGTDLSAPWEFYVRDAETGKFHWQETFPTKEEMSRSVIMENDHLAAKPWVFKDDGKYYMVSQSSALTTDVYIYRSDTPYGPFKDQKLLFNLPARIDKKGSQDYSRIYQVNIHPELSRSGELVFSACTQPNDFWDNMKYEGSADYFRPYFFRVFNWKSVYSN